MAKIGVMPEDSRFARQKDNLEHLGVLGIFAGIVLGAVAIVLCLILYRKPVPECPEPEFTSIVQRNLVSRDVEGFSKSIDLSRIRTFSFLVRNDGPNPVVAQTELSPDGVTWSSFGESSYVIEPGDKHLFVPQFFLRYARIKFRNKKPGMDTLITVWFQGQG
ncbi:hypothetical protein J2Z49_000043 [Desulfofundulus luciae]|uniref:DUF6385 domain-containing protein n=1 Tax=Desulfofundulus luciae TaxID=74702 RepID=A0ABU0AWU4_9FIRM|nr:DUF6385 domain-containing protein [Desulfofundulus luciae]MDQ0284953.1 hypothetical protein [Desulfofundulus luciae]